MALSVEQAWRFAQALEKDLHAKLEGKGTPFEDLTSLMTQYRSACEITIFSDFRIATSKNVEARLWDAHSMVNNRFRNGFSRFRREDGKGKHVEKRKLAKQYLEFIKASQRFYRSYIHQLSARFGGIPEIELVAHELTPDRKSVTNQQIPSEDFRQSILLSCYQTLVRLGDLSRYRETELVSKDRNWGPAIGYYDLACTIYPQSGAAHNQLAVIALADGNHLRATYHLYRALAVQEPHPTAKGNLEIEFNKVFTAWRKGNLIVKGPGRTDSAAQVLRAWFVLLHARCYKGEEFAEHDELEKEVLNHLTVDLKERPLDSTLHRYILINIAAQYFAGVRLRETPHSKECIQASFFFLRLNVKTFSRLLQSMQPELETLINAEGHNKKASSTSTSAKLTPVSLRVLPALRSYSSWLACNSELLVAQITNDDLRAQIKELWKVYTKTMTLLAAVYPAAELPSVEYLLEEDADTTGFVPFVSDRVQRRYKRDWGQNKPRWHDLGVKRLEKEEEFLARIRDLLVDALELAVDESIPVTLANSGTFSYVDGPEPAPLVSAEHEPAEPELYKAEQREYSRMDSGKTSEINGNTQSSHSIDDFVPEDIDLSEQGAIAMSADMSHMVDSLVGPESANADDAYDDKENNSLASGLMAQQQSGTSYGTPSTMTAAHLVDAVQNYSQRASPANQLASLNRGTTGSRPPSWLPSILNSPFAPQPADMSLSSSSSPRSRPTTAIGPMHATQTTGSPLASNSASFIPDSSWIASTSLFPVRSSSSTAKANSGEQGSRILDASTVYGNDSTYAEMNALEPFWDSRGAGGNGRPLDRAVGGSRGTPVGRGSRG